MDSPGDDDDVFRDVFKGCALDFDPSTTNSQEAVSQDKGESSKDSGKQISQPTRNLESAKTENAQEVLKKPPVLVWDILSIKSKSPNGDQSAEALVKFEPYECECDIFIWEGKEVQPVVHDARPCFVSQGEPGKSLVKLKLETPFELDIDKLFAPTESRFQATPTTAGRYTVKIILGTSYIGPDCSWPPFVISGGFDESTARMSLITAVFSHLPACPGQTLDTHFQTPNCVSHATDYALEVDVKWSNQGLTLPDTPKSPTSAANVEKPPQDPPKPAKLTLMFMHDTRVVKTLYTERWKCMFCRNRDLKTWDVFRGHVYNFHKDLVFSFGKTYKELLEDIDLNRDISIGIMPYRVFKQQMATEGKDAKEICREKPKRQLSLDADLDGDKSLAKDVGIANELGGNPKRKQIKIDDICNPSDENPNPTNSGKILDDGKIEGKNDTHDSS